MLPDDASRAMSTLAMVGQLGVIMVVCIAGGLLSGLYLDRLLGTRPALAIVLLLAGVFGGMTAVYRTVMRAVRDRPQDPDDSRTEGTPGPR